MTTTNKCLECSYLGDDVYKFCDKHRPLHCPICATSLDQHEAGSCLDAWAAMVIFGWKWYRSSATKHRAIFPKETEAPEWFSELTDGTEPFAYDWNCRLPDYSTDIATAWQLVDDWRDPNRPGGYGEMLMIRSEGSRDDGIFIVEFGVNARGVAADLSLAICKAAIKAKS